MRIILEKQETEQLFNHLIESTDTDNPKQLESIEIQNRLRDIIIHYQDYPDLASYFEDSVFLRHLLWFSPYKIDFTPLGEMVCYVDIDPFYTRG